MVNVHVEIDYLIEWRLIPTFAVFHLFRGVTCSEEIGSFNRQFLIYL